MVDFHDKDWVNHIIVAGGVIVGILILVGLISSIREYYGGRDSSSSTSECENCLTQKENNKPRTIDSGESFTIDLPETLYPEANLLIIEDPEGIIKEDDDRDPSVQGNWARTFKAEGKGRAEVIVKSAYTTASDYHISLTIK